MFNEFEMLQKLSHAKPTVIEPNKSEHKTRIVVELSNQSAKINHGSKQNLDLIRRFFNQKKNLKVRKKLKIN